MKTLSAVFVVVLSLLIGATGCGKRDDKTSAVVAKAPPKAKDRKSVV